MLLLYLRENSKVEDMDMKVKNLIEQFEGFKVLAGNGGLDREIKYPSPALTY